MSDTSKQVLGLAGVILATSLLCIALYYVDNKYQGGGLQAAEGLLVVGEDDLEAHPVNYLVAGWAFYPDTLLAPPDFAKGSPDRYMFYTDIGNQPHFNSTGNPQNPHGSGSYFLRLRLPDEAQTYALELPEIFSAYKLYVDGRLMLQMGNPEKEGYAPLTQNRIILFEASGQTTLLIAVSDYSHFYSGMVYPPAFGTFLAVNATRELRMGIALVVNTLALLAAALALYFGFRMKHKDAKLFSLVCLVVCIFTSYSLFHSLLALPVFPWYALEMSSGYLLSLLLVVLHNRICEVDLYAKRISVAVASAVFFIALCYGLGSATLTLPLMRAFSILVFCFKLALSGYLFATAFLSLRRNNRRAVPLFYASIIYATVAMCDRILPAYEPILGGWFIEWGGLALVCAIGYTLWQEIITAHRNNLVFAEEHRRMTRQLAMQTEYARQLQQSEEENKKLTHDFRQHLRTVTGIVSQLHSSPETEKKQQELLHYLKRISQATVMTSYFQGGGFCENVAIDALLQYYYGLSKQNGIQPSFCFQQPKELPISDVELCTVLGNLLENAVEACQRCNSQPKHIRIRTECTSHVFRLLVENSYNGCFEKVDGRFLSNKCREVRFGIGLEAVRHIVEKHKGTLDVFPSETIFRVGIVLLIKGGAAMAPP